MNLTILRAVNQAQIATLRKQPHDSAELFQAQVVEQILADDLCFHKLTLAQLAEVLVAVGYKVADAEDEAKRIKDQLGA